MPDFHQLNCFLLVAETLNFSEAARRAGMVQSSVSRTISDLENQLHTKLFYRTKWEVSLTETGLAFLPYAQKLVETMSEGAGLVRQIETGRTGRLSFSSLSSSSAFLMACIAEFSARHPDVLVDVTHNTGQEQQAALLERKHDVYLTYESMLPRDHSLEYFVSHQDCLAVVLPKKHPLAGQPLDFSKLAGENFILPTEASSPLLYAQILDICRLHHYEPHVVGRYNQAESILLAVSAGLGISILPRGLARIFLPLTCAALPIEGPESLRSYVVAWNPKNQNPSLQAFLALSDSILHKYQDWPRTFYEETGIDAYLE